jgi:hypothetical protein
VQGLRAKLVGKFATAAIVLVVVAGACGSDSKNAESSSTTAASGQPVQNACPVDGCQVEIQDVAREGDELRITWKANYEPDVSHNHIHVYWDTYDTKQVSNDAESKYGVTQGEWVPTDSYPEFVTQGAVAVGQRAGSTTVCVTPGDKDHNVIDVLVENCRDVADLL